ncbi:DUF1772 domain-containing protein [Planctobacterium marinum]|uniref:Membrane protein n=1 Tax=Planctobacterium marinum TaxID=1631968 RepID=A0AA48HQ35_9ALTE|nr:membrane protein [Planctobacterium marinum]
MIEVISILEVLLQLSMLLMMGLYFIFSNTLMPVLSRQKGGADTMIAINKVILNPLFMAGFIVSGLAGLYYFISFSGAKSLAGVVFFLGTTLVTVLFNVPLNNKLRDASELNKAAVWELYLKKWVFWNHVRTLCAVLSGFLLLA